jgi:hypothetical protein
MKMSGPDGSRRSGDIQTTDALTASASETSPKRQKGRRNERIWSIGLDRSFKPHEFERFMGVIRDTKYKTAFYLQAY